MPGVPSSRGCDGCRKQKKKCDEAKPKCSRCQRLQLACVGSGEKRYKFRTHCKTQDVPGKREPRWTSSVSGNQDVGTPLGSLTQVSSNDLSLLLGAFCQTIKPPADLRYNMALTYGGFFLDIPRRLGSNEALDAAVEVLTNAHTDLCRQRQDIAPRTLSMYSRALRSLRTCLNDPVKARTSETLCAIMLLLISQAFIGVNGQRWTSHCEGAAQILKARGYYDPKDEFESRLLLSLRGPVLFEGLFNDRIQFSALEWKTLVENGLDGTSCEGQMMCCLAQAPDILQRGKRMRWGESVDQNLLEELKLLYQNMQAVLGRLQGRVADLERSFVNGSQALASHTLLHALYQRSYGLGLTVAIILNCMLGAISTKEERSWLASEAMHYSNETVALVEPASKQRPLGASYMTLCLIAAYIGTTDEATKVSIRAKLAEFQRDFPWAQSMISERDLDNVSRRLRFHDPNPM